MLKPVLFATLIVAQSFASCVNSFKSAIPTGADAVASLDGFGGSWASLAPSTAPQACTDFAWSITEVTTSGVSGTWSARCYTTVNVSGTATGALVDGEVRWTAAATGTANGVGSCPVALAGTAHLKDSQIRIPYTGTTCLGPVAGTEMLRK